MGRPGRRGEGTHGLITGGGQMRRDIKERSHEDHNMMYYYNNYGICYRKQPRHKLDYRFGQKGTFAALHNKITIFKKVQFREVAMIA